MFRSLGLLYTSLYSRLCQNWVHRMILVCFMRLYWVYTIFFACLPKSVIVQKRRMTIRNEIRTHLLWLGIQLNVALHRTLPLVEHLVPTLPEGVVQRHAHEAVVQANWPALLGPRGGRELLLHEVEPWKRSDSRRIRILLRWIADVCHKRIVVSAQAVTALWT